MLNPTKMLLALGLDNTFAIRLALWYQMLAELLGGALMTKNLIFLLTYDRRKYSIVSDSVEKSR